MRSMVRPLGRARVSLIDTKIALRLVSMVTSESGHFEFRGLPAGKIALEGAKTRVSRGRSNSMNNSSTAIVTEQDSHRNLVLRLTPFALLSGRLSMSRGSSS